MYVYHGVLILSDTFVLQNCTVTSPSMGNIRVSCDVPHEIIVTATCYLSNNCDNSMVTVIGNSPVVVAGLDPGVRYSVTVNVFNDNQEGLPDQTVTQDLEVNSGETSFHGTTLKQCSRKEKRDCNVMYIQ